MCRDWTNSLCVCQPLFKLCSCLQLLALQTLFCYKTFCLGFTDGSLSPPLMSRSLFFCVSWRASLWLHPRPSLRRSTSPRLLSARRVPTPSTNSLTRSWRNTVGRWSRNRKEAKVQVTKHEMNDIILISFIKRSLSFQCSVKPLIIQSSQLSQIFHTGFFIINEIHK